jgi:hypothetical protein
VAAEQAEQDLLHLVVLLELVELENNLQLLERQLITQAEAEEAITIDHHLAEELVDSAEAEQETVVMVTLELLEHQTLAAEAAAAEQTLQEVVAQEDLEL